MINLAPHGGDALGATPGHPLLTPALSAAPGLSMSRQQALLDLQAIQRIPGLAGYWPADPAYIYQDSAGYIPATVGGVVGQVRDISNAATPVARRNLLTYSEQFDNAAWTKNQVLNFGSGSTANAILAPDETLTADKLVENSSSAARGVYLTYGVTAGVSYTLSCYAKKGERNFVWLKLSDNATNWARSFNLDTGAVGGLVTSFSAPTSSSIQAIGDGWYRCSISAVAGVTNSTSNHDIGFCAQDGVRTYQGDGTSGIYIWGAQLEVGASATPYQKIEGGTGEVFAPGNHAYQTTTANKPYLRRTPTSNVHWLDSNTANSTITATLGNLGSACTVCQAGAEGVTFTEGVTISSTYNIAPAFSFNTDTAIFNRALTATEKALVTRYMQRGVPVLGSEIITNGTFESGNLTGFAETFATVVQAADGEKIGDYSGSLESTTDSNTVRLICFPDLLGANKAYLASCYISNVLIKGELIINSARTGLASDTVPQALRKVQLVYRTSTAASMYLGFDGAVTYAIGTRLNMLDNITVKEIL